MARSARIRTRARAEPTILSRLSPRSHTPPTGEQRQRLALGRAPAQRTSRPLDDGTAEAPDSQHGKSGVVRLTSV